MNFFHFLLVRDLRILDDALPEILVELEVKNIIHCNGQFAMMRGTYVSIMQIQSSHSLRFFQSNGPSLKAVSPLAWGKGKILYFRNPYVLEPTTRINKSTRSAVDEFGEAQPHGI